MMTAQHPYIADTCSFAGLFLLLTKFWTWKEAKHETAKKTALLLAGVTVLTISLFAGLCWLSYYLNLPKHSVIESTSHTPKIANSVESGKPNETSKSVSPSPATSVQKAQHIQARPKSSVPVRVPEAAPVSRQASTYGGQTCVGSACAQGPNSQATLNQFGAPKLIMTDSQRDLLRDAMKPYAGIGVDIFCHDATEDSFAYAQQLAKALRDAGITVSGPDSGMGFSSGVIPSGVSLLVGEDRVQAATVMANAMSAAGLIHSAIPAVKNLQRKDGFHITIAPNC